MSWQTLLVQSPASLTRQQNQLACRQANPDDPTLPDQTLTLPVEDLAVVILESPQIRITSALLGFLQSHDVVVMTCDEAHMPNGLLMPFHQHSRHAQVANLQTAWSEPFKKRCWQRVIRQKILNQAECLARCQRNGAGELRAIADTVGSGDVTNREGYAAKLYWSGLFGPGFERFEHTTWIPAALNYGYAILRAAMARTVAAAGLLPCLGLHHKSDLNAFNLVDDLLEPLRPVVDEVVYTLRAKYWANDPYPELPGDMRHRLARLGGVACRIGTDTFSVQNACEAVAESLVAALRQKSPTLLRTPEFA